MTEGATDEVAVLFYIDGPDVEVVGIYEDIAAAQSVAAKSDMLHVAAGPIVFSEHSQTEH